MLENISYPIRQRQRQHYYAMSMPAGHRIHVIGIL